MKPFQQAIEELGKKVPDGDIDEQWFIDNGISPIVACCHCGMTMVCFSSFVDDNGNLWCSDCSE